MTDQVLHRRGLTPDGEMGLVGYAIAAGVGLLLLPVLPFIAVLWLLRKLGEDGRKRRGPRPS